MAISSLIKVKCPQETEASKDEIENSMPHIQDVSEGRILTTEDENLTMNMRLSLRKRWARGV
jgi:hypothetical protein